MSIKQAHDEFWKLILHKLIEAALSCVGESNSEVDTIAIEFARYWQNKYETYCTEDEPPFPMTDDNTHLG